MSGPTIGLALGGGGARGFAHIHALEAFDDLGLRPNVVAGTSMGAIVGAAYAAGMSGADVLDFAQERFRNRLRLTADLLRMKPENARQFLDHGGLRLGEINVERVITVLLPRSFPTDFRHLVTPLKVIATDFHDRSEHVFESGPLIPALAASSAIPALFRPVMVDGTVYIDGGTTNPTPFDRLSGVVDIVVAVDVCGWPRGTRGMRHRKLDVLTSSTQIMQQSITRAKAALCRPDILLKPDMSGIRIHDFMKLKAILLATRPLRETLKKELDVALERHAASCRAS